MLAILVALIEIGLGLAKLGFVADLLSSEVQVGYMNGLAVTIIVGQLPKLFGFSTDADGFVDEIRAFFAVSTRPMPVAARRRRGACDPAAPAPFHPSRPGGARRRSSGDRRLRPARPRRHGVRRSARCPRASPPALPWTKLADVGPLLVAAVGSRSSRSLTRSRPVEPRRAAARRWEPNQEMIGIGAANVAAGFLQGFAVSTSGPHRGGRAIRGHAQLPASSVPASSLLLSS